jgi:hypothetical protein
MKTNKSNGTLMKNPLSFQERFKDKISNIGRQGPTGAIFSRPASLRPIQKENILPPIFQNSVRVHLSPEGHNNFTQHKNNSVGHKMKA